MKAFTDLEQSRKLAEILPFESADMHYNNVSIKGINYADEHRAELMGYNRAIKVLSKYTINPLFEVIPCWSLAALLGVMPSATLDSSDDHNYRVHCKEMFTNWYYNPVDACVAMIEKLNELKML